MNLVVSRRKIDFGLFPYLFHRHIHPWTYGEDIGVLEIASITITGEEYVGKGWRDVSKYPLELWRREETPEPSMVDRNVKAVQRSTTPVRGLCQRQERVTWTPMRQCRMGECGSTLEVRRHLERSWGTSWYQSSRLQRTCQEMGPLATNHLHWVQTYSSSPSPSACLEGNERRIGKDHRKEEQVHGLRWQRSNQTGNRKIRQGNLVMAGSSSCNYGTHQEHWRCSDQLNPSVGNTLGGGFHSRCSTPLRGFSLKDWGPEVETEPIHALRPSPHGVGDHRPVSHPTFQEAGRNGGLHLPHLWHFVNVWGQDFGRRPHPSATDHPFLILRWSLVRRSEWWWILSALGEQGTRAIGVVRQGCKEDCNCGTVRPTLGEHPPWWQLSWQGRDQETPYDQEWTRLHPGLDIWNAAISLMAIVHRPEKAGCRTMPRMLVWNTGSVVALLTLQGPSDQSWLEEANLEEPEKSPEDEEVKDHAKSSWDHWDLSQP